uniref:Ribosomal protein L6 n=1 Tax=Balbiania investiens TaxID=111861 RepID=A0A4D6BNQ4_9FLOR|nr:ribosomal protein L6 [Balbiania investiens]QBX88609.1 ribosomal protein L6 [Balbiania investiens]
MDLEVKFYVTFGKQQLIGTIYMSRIGKQCIILSEKIKTTIKENIVTIRGPKGELSQEISKLIGIKLQESSTSQILSLYVINNTKQSKQLHGLSRTLISNMMIGVTEGFSKYLEIQGIGYRSQIDGKNLVLSVGFSHPVTIEPPVNINIKVENNINIIVSGIDKELVGQVAATIRAIRPPEPYKGKGIRYRGEIIKRKVGKAGK